MGLFVGIIAGGVLLVVLLIAIVVYVHRRNKRKLKEGAFDKPALSVLSLAQPRPPLPVYHSSYRDNSLDDREAQQQLVGREVMQQEATYQQLMRDLQRPSSRADTESLPDQAPRDMTAFRRPPMQQREPIRSPLTAPPLITAPPPVALTQPADKASHLQRGLSVRSLDSASESIYSTTSAPYSTRDANEGYQSFTAALPAIPASPTTPKWPSSPNPYVWPKRQRASVIRDELAPETYAKVRWKTQGAAPPATGTNPVAQALPPTPTTPRAAHGLRIVPPAADMDGGLYFTPASAAFPRSPPAAPPQPRTPQRF
jgi:hypothetical protein